MQNETARLEQAVPAHVAFRRRLAFRITEYGALMQNRRCPYSGVIPADFATFCHFSVSDLM